MPTIEQVGDTLKSVLFHHLDQGARSPGGPFRGDGLRYTKAVLDCIRAVTGEEPDAVLDEVEEMLTAATPVRTEVRRRLAAGEDRAELQADLGLSDGQWNRIRGVPPHR